MFLESCTLEFIRQSLIKSVYSFFLLAILHFLSVILKFVLNNIILHNLRLRTSQSYCGR